MLDSQPLCLPSRQQPCCALDKALVASKIYSDGFKADTEAMEGELCRGGNVQIKMSEQEEASRCLKMLKRSVRHWVRSPQTQKMDVVYRTQHRGEPKSLPSTSLQPSLPESARERPGEVRIWKCQHREQRLCHHRDPTCHPHVGSGLRRSRRTDLDP